jgi:predicted amidohydrolase
MSNIKVTLVQSPIYWEDPAANRKMFEEKIRQIDEPTEIIVLPEVFTTGFTMEPAGCAEPHKGETFQWMKKLAAEKNAVITGSIATKEKDKYYNRLIWMQPDGNHFQYDKKHLFTFAGETKNFTPGKEKVIVEYKGWKFLLLICYDLRFPVWSKNNYSAEKGFDYDCIINIANWPAPRSHPWRVLLMARAIENQAYVIGVNRIGTDGRGIEHSGDSALISPLGENFSNIMPNEEKTETIPMPRCQLDDFRKKFRVADDWDKFEISA